MKKKLTKAQILKRRAYQREYSRKRRRENGAIPRKSKLNSEVSDRVAASSKNVDEIVNAFQVLRRNTKGEAKAQLEKIFVDAITEGQEG